MEGEVAYQRSSSKLKMESQTLLPSPSVTHFFKKAVWDGIVVEHYRQPPGECKLCIPQHTIRIALKDCIIQRRVEGGRLLSNHVTNGDIAVFPSHIQQWIRWEENAEYILIFLDSSLVARAAAELNYAQGIEIIGKCEEVRDPQLEHIGLALKAELEEEGLAGSLYSESLANSLAVHLLRRHSAFRQKVKNFSSGLAPRQLRLALEYINEKLEYDVGLLEIAEAVEMSPYHFARLFKQSTGLAPHQYVIERRIERAKELLANKDLPIVEIAYSLGFASQSHFTATFRKLVAITPKAYRQSLLVPDSE